MKGEHTHRRDSLPEDRSITFYLDGRTSSPIDLPVGFSLDKCTGKLNNTWFETFLTSHLGGGTQRKLSFATDTVAPRQLHRELQTPEDLRRWAELYISETHIEVGSPVPGGKGVYESVGELFDYKYYDRDLSLQEVQLDFHSGVENGVPLLPGTLPTPPISTVETVIDQYPKHTVSIMPSVILQERVKTSRCDAGLSFSRQLESYLSSQFTKRCTTVYSCTFPSIGDGESSTNYACTGEQTETSEFYGVKPQTFLGNLVYADFLHVFDSSIIKRGAGDTRLTRNWIDIKTRQVSVIMSFYTPTLRIGTLVTIRFSLEQERIVSTYSLDSVHSIPQQLLFHTLICVVSFLVLIRLAAAFYRSAVKKRIGITRFWCIVDFLLGIVFMVAVGSMFMSRFSLQGEELFNTYFTKIIKIPWTSEAIAPEEKFRQFFEALQDIWQLTNILLVSKTIVAILLYLYFARICVYMSAHPRVAVLVRTCVLASNDLFHFLLTFLMLYIILAFIGYFQFGMHFFTFSSIAESLMTQFKMLVGSWPAEITNSNDSALIVYFVIFALVVVFILLNFFVAIIIEKYDMAKYQLEGMECEVNNILVDSFDLIIQSLAATRNRWPPRPEVIAELEDMDIDGDTVITATGRTTRASRTGRSDAFGLCTVTTHGTPTTA